MKVFKKLSFVFLAIWMVSCAGPTTTDIEDPGEVMIVYTDWAESIAMTYMAQVLIERHIGYDVVLKLNDVDEVFAEIAASEADVFLDAWLPATHIEYLEMYEGSFEDLGPNYRNARTGLVVPDYMDMQSIDQMNEYYPGGQIAGIDSTAGIMRSAFIALDMYDLENELMVLSDAEMSERLEEAIKRRQDIVVTGWEPHWLFHRYDLRYLEDPHNVFMETEDIHTIARNGFSEEHPHLTEFFQRMVLSEKKMNELLYEMKLEPDALEGVKNWIRKNEFTVNQWTRGLGTEREKIM